MSNHKVLIGSTGEEYGNKVVVENDIGGTNKPTPNNENIPSKLGATLSDTGNPNVLLSNLKAKNNERLIIGHINVNSLENKF